MDINELKKRVEESTEIDAMIQRITREIKSHRDGIQARQYESEELFKPVIEAQEEIKKTIDNKQDELIKQLQDNQKSLVSGLEDVIMYNKLPNQVETKKEPLPVGYQPKLTKTLKSDFNKSFIASELDILDSMGMISPARLSTTEYSEDKIYEILDKSNKLCQKIGAEKGTLTKKENKRNNQLQLNEITQDKYNEEIRKIEEKKNSANNKMDILKKYIDRIKIIPDGKKTIGTSIRRYKQPKRHAYTVSHDGMYGGLFINQPRLLDEMVIEAHRGGQIVYENNGDKSLVDLLTKRFIQKRSILLRLYKYSTI